MIRWFAKKFSRKLILSFCSTIILAMALTGFLLTNAFRNQLIHEVTNSLYTQARLISSELKDLSFSANESRRLHELAHQYGKASKSRITFIDAGGRVLGDSELSFAEIAGVENHKDRLEVQSVLQGQQGYAIRHSHTVGHDFLYAAIPHLKDGRVIGIIRMAIPLTQVYDKIGHVRRTTALITLAMMMLSVGIALWLSRSLSAPVREMSEVANRLADGDYEARLRNLSSDEHGQLGNTLNMLVERVRTTIDEIARDKSQLSAILSNMVEAVVAVDAQCRVLFTNVSLSRLFGSSPEEVCGRPFLEAFRNNQLDDLIRSVLKNCVEQSSEVIIFAPDEHIFQAHAAPLIQDGKCTGALVVFHEITRIRELEQMRKDFVANVSHELRTPLASVAASAETLLSGALEDPEHRLEFVQAIQQDATRLTMLVDDLLNLSAIESGKQPPRLKPLSLMEIAKESIEAVKKVAARSNVKIEVESPAHLPLVKLDKEQIKQVFMNLLDNAIKFNKEKGTVRVWAATDGRSVTISVQDTGIGIPSKDLPRIYERFYRVDKARSRELGGTGLGLSIVKHIIEAHGGSVGVESIEGQGSTFYFKLPVHS